MRKHISNMVKLPVKYEERINNIMSLLVFENDNSTIYKASVYTIGSNQIRIVFDPSIETIPGNDTIYSGFITVNEYNHTKEAHYRDYIYKYRDVEDSRTFDLDNNDQPYVPPAPPTPPTPPEPPAPPTLQEVLNQKITELSSNCHIEIESGIDLRINGNIEHFSYSLSGGDQNNIDDLFNTMNLTLAPQYYHADGSSCKLYTPAQIFYIYFGNKAQTQDAVTYYNQLALWLRDTYGNAEDTEANRNAVQSVIWRATGLIGHYLELYEAVLAQGQSQLEAFKKSLEDRGVDFSENIYPVVPNEDDIVVEDTVGFDDILEAADEAEDVEEDSTEETESEE